MADNEFTQQNRRHFIARGAAAAGAGLAAATAVAQQGVERSVLVPSSKPSAPTPAEPLRLPEEIDEPQPLQPVSAEGPAGPILTPGATVLFQGDSITDARRQRGSAVPNDKSALGKGYAFLATAELLIAYPDYGLQVYNRGISGNKVPDLAARWQADCLDLMPDVVSILIGVNDLWHRFTKGYQGTPESYLSGYRALIERTKASLPAAKLVLCEPFIFKVGKVDDKFFPAYDAYREAAESLAAEYADAWVPFMSMFQAATEIAPPEAWVPDGVHPSPAGSALMASTWVRSVEAAGLASTPAAEPVEAVTYKQPA
ncbi:MAG: SGNH/GDSL hydrolase family protein, partial [Planctomycetota bacterium]